MAEGEYILCSGRLLVVIAIMFGCSITLLVSDATMSKRVLKESKTKVPEYVYQIKHESILERIYNDAKLKISNENHVPDKKENLGEKILSWEDRNALCTNNNRKEKSERILNGIYEKCQDERFKVPNVVHYIWFGCKRQFDFYNYISIVTSLKNMHSCATVVHSDCEPTSDWWKKLKQEQKFFVVYQEPPTKVYGHPISRVHHQADVARLDILLKWGGIYLDDTVLGIRPFDDLRNYSTVLPFQEHGILNNGVIIAEKNALFLQLWRKESYMRYKSEAWAFNSCRYPWILWKSNRKVDLHVEMETFLPKWDGWRSVFMGNYPWRGNYAIHLYTNRLKRLPGKPNYPDHVKQMTSSFGEIVRMTLFNTTDLIH